MKIKHRSRKLNTDKEKQFEYIGKPLLSVLSYYKALLTSDFSLDIFFPYDCMNLSKTIYLQLRIKKIIIHLFNRNYWFRRGVINWLIISSGNFIENYEGYAYTIFIIKCFTEQIKLSFLNLYVCLILKTMLISQSPFILAFRKQDSIV